MNYIKKNQNQSQFKMVEGVVLEAPMERHTHSRWIVVQTEGGHCIRVVVASSAPAVNWVEPGDRVHVSGRMVEKQWQDGPHQTLSAHEGIQIVKSRLTREGGVRA